MNYTVLPRFFGSKIGQWSDILSIQQPPSINLASHVSPFLKLPEDSCTVKLIRFASPFNYEILVLVQTRFIHRSVVDRFFFHVQEFPDCVSGEPQDFCDLSF